MVDYSRTPHAPTVHYMDTCRAHPRGDTRARAADTHYDTNYSEPSPTASTTVAAMLLYSLEVQTNVECTE